MASDKTYKTKTKGEKMYNAKNAKELEGNGLPKDSILDAIIINIQDGKVKDFVKDTTKWKNPESLAINVEMEIKIEGGFVKLKEIITYISENNQTAFTKGSKLGKYKAKYNKLPEVGDQLKIITDGEGYGEIKLN